MFAINGSRSLPTPPPSTDYAAPSTFKQISSVFDSPHHRHMWIITGPAGCGKSTVAQYLAKELSLPYIEGDDVCIPSGAGIVNGIACSHDAF